MQIIHVSHTYRPYIIQIQIPFNPTYFDISNFHGLFIIINQNIYQCFKVIVSLVPKFQMYL